MTRIRIVGGQDFRDLIQDLKNEADGKKRISKLKKELRAAAKPTVPALKAAIQKIPSKGHGRRKGRKGTLRSELSQAVTLQVRTTRSGAGVSVFMNPRKMPTGTKALPAYFEQTPGYTDLIHPLFGNEEKLVYQGVSANGYFTDTVRPIADRAEEACQKIVDDVVKDLES